MPELQNGQEPIEVTPTDSPTPKQLMEMAKNATAGAAPKEKAEAAPAEPAAAATTDATGDQDAADAGKDASDGEQTPAWKQKQEESANREAAATRIKLREAQAEIERLKGVSDENASLKDQLTVAQVALERADVVAEFGIPKEIAGLVAGNTVEELKASAQLLAKHLSTGTAPAFPRREPAGGGLDPFNGTEPVSAKSAYEKAKGLRF